MVEAYEFFAWNGKELYSRTNNIRPLFESGPIAEAYQHAYREGLDKLMVFPQVYARLIAMQREVVKLESERKIEDAIKIIEQYKPELFIVHRYVPRIPLLP